MRKTRTNPWRATKEYPHGKNRYDLNGCRCDVCREAARLHVAAVRKRLKAGIRAFVDAKPVRQHIIKLGRLGVGTAPVADAAKTRQHTIWLIRSGLQKRLRRELAERILEVDVSVRLDGAKISGAATRRAIKKLRSLGVTTKEIAAEGFGWPDCNLSVPKYGVTVRTEARVLRFLREVERAVEIGRDVKDVCYQCGLDHGKLARITRLRRFDRSSVFMDAHEAWPCIYPNTPSGQRMYYFDIDALRGKPRQQYRQVSP